MAVRPKAGTCPTVRDHDANAAQNPWRLTVGRTLDLFGTFIKGFNFGKVSRDKPFAMVGGWWGSGASSDFTPSGVLYPISPRGLPSRSSLVMPMPSRMVTLPARAPREPGPQCCRWSCPIPCHRGRTSDRTGNRHAPHERKENFWLKKSGRSPEQLAAVRSGPASDAATRTEPSSGRAKRAAAVPGTCQSARQMHLGIRVIPSKAVGVRHRVLRHNLRHGFSKQPLLDRHLQLLTG